MRYIASSSLKRMAGRSGWIPASPVRDRAPIPIQGWTCACVTTSPQRLKYHALCHSGEAHTAGRRGTRVQLMGV